MQAAPIAGMDAEMDMPFVDSQQVVRSGRAGLEAAKSSANELLETDLCPFSEHVLGVLVNECATNGCDWKCRAEWRRVTLCLPQLWLYQPSGESLSLSSRQGQLEISQPQSGWSSPPRSSVLKGRWKGVRYPSSRRDETFCSPQTRHLVSG